jgi:hypothetical protein
MLKHALRARRFFPLAPRHQAARQAVAYMKAIEYLGDRWLLAKASARLITPRPV